MPGCMKVSLDVMRVVAGAVAVVVAVVIVAVRKVRMKI